MTEVNTDSVFLYSGYDGYLPSATLVYSGTTLGSQASPVILNGNGANYLLVIDGGHAEYVTVSDYNCYTEIRKGGSISNLTIKGYGVATAGSLSTVSQVFIKSDGQFSLEGTGTDITVDGVLNLTGSASDATVSYGGVIRVSDESAVMDGISSMGGQLYVSKGLAQNITVTQGGHVYLSGGKLSNATFEDGSALDTLTGAQEGWVLSNITFQQGSFARLYSGTVLAETIHLGIGLSLQGTVDASQATLDFNLAGRSENDGAFISDWTLCAAREIELTVSADQKTGTYALTDNASSFVAPVTLNCESFESIAMQSNGVATYHDRVYTLVLAGEEDTLSVDVRVFQSQADASGLRWGDINGAASCVLELSDGTSTLVGDVSAQGVDLYGLGLGSYTWTIRNASESDNTQTGQAFSQTMVAEEPQFFDAGETNKTTDLFFARVDGIWDTGFTAQHVGNQGGWDGTGETVELAGKARIVDIFAGSEDASVLFLDAFSVGTESGVALFLDDIYSAMPTSSGSSARISQINTIQATGGDDIIDLTSKRFALDGGVFVDGGAGDDVIWANSGANTLLGSDGDDHIIGGSDADVISGGAGNDVLHGGGGEDTFCFGDGWGADTVMQCTGAENTVTFWFSGSKEDLNLEFTGEGNDTLVRAASGDTIRVVNRSISLSDCRFGAEVGFETKYAALAVAGVFE